MAPEPQPTAPRPWVHAPPPRDQRVSFTGTFGLIRADVLAYAHHNRMPRVGPLKALSILLIPPVQWLVLQRWSHYFFGLRWFLVARLLYQVNLTLFGADVSPSSRFAGGVYMPHPVGLAIVGRIETGTFLSSLAGMGGGTPVLDDVGAGPGFPVIEEWCYVGAKSSVVGGIRVGARSVVAAHSLVTQSFPPDSLIAGVPARLIRTLQPGEFERLTGLPERPASAAPYGTASARRDSG